MKRSEIIDYIKAFGAKLGIGSLATYDTLPVTGDLEDNDIPAWGNVLAATGGTLPIPVTVTAGDSQPLTIPYTGITNPFAIFRLPDGTRYAGATDQDDGSNIIVTGDGGSTFADTFVVIVKV